MNSSRDSMGLMTGRLRLIFQILCFFLLGLPVSATHYPTSYLESRAHFRSFEQKLREISPNLQPFEKKLPSKTYDDLTIDGFYLPQEGQQSHLTIVTSGIHGVEAYTGSAIQFEFITSNISKELLRKSGLLIIHSINPYGYRANRRVDENNVDLNRNFSATPEQFQSFSKDYKDFNPFLNPKTALKMSSLQDLLLFTQSVYRLLVYGRGKMAQVAVGGQYQQQDGIYFGGKKTSDNARLIKEVFRKYAKNYKAIYHVDLHTGYGEKGRLHFFTTGRIAKLPAVQNVFKGFNLDLGDDDEDFYEASGDFNRFTLDTFPDKPIVIPMTFEFGTMDSQTTIGGFYSLRNMIFENQGFLHGYASDDDQKAIQKDFLEMFNPSDPKWRTKAINEGTNTMLKTIERFSNIKPT